MKITLLTIGKTSSAYLTTGIDDYLSRVKHFADLQLVCLPDVKNARNLTAAQQKQAEWKIILDAIEPSDHVVLLDERGKQASSAEFATMLQKRMASGLKRLVFVIGGPYGFDQAVYDRADGLLSLSKMTFSHEMVRLFFVEQIYRAFTIINHLPYHHE